MLVIHVYAERYEFARGLTRRTFISEFLSGSRLSILYVFGKDLYVIETD